MNSLVSRRVHCIGIGGIGVSAIARLFLYWGSAVSGSDAKRSEITDELAQLGAVVSIRHTAENVPAGTALVVYSPAVPADNPERAEAARLGIPQKSYPEMLGELMAGTYGIAVSGTNGKTTTTAFLGHILAEAGLDPTVIVGSKVKNFGGSNLRVGEGRLDPPAGGRGVNHFVVEGCEYRRHFVNLRPKMIVLTNIEVDHLDYFKDFDDIKTAFREYVGLLPPDGTLVFNADDPACVEVAESSECKKVPYHPAVKRSSIPAYWSGSQDRDGSAGVWLPKRVFQEGHQTLRVAGAGAEFDVTLQLPGQIYAANALAAIAAAHTLGVSPEQIALAVASFKGTWRRFEIVCLPADGKGKVVVSDYAHHPTSVRETIKAAREFFPGRRLLVVFQPHQRNRTKNLLEGFVESLALADQVIVCEIFDVAGREEADAAQQISSRDIAARLQKTGRPALYAADLTEAERLAREELAAADVALVLGAGDIYAIAQKLC